MLSENNLLSTIYFWFALSQDWFPFSTIQRADDASYITRTKVSERHIWSSSMNIRSHDYSLKQKTGSLNRMFEYHDIVMVFVIKWKKPDFEISHEVLCLRWILSKALYYTLAPCKELWRLVDPMTLWEPGRAGATIIVYWPQQNMYDTEVNSCLVRLIRRA